MSWFCTLLGIIQMQTVLCSKRFQYLVSMFQLCGFYWDQKLNQIITDYDRKLKTSNCYKNNN